VPVVARVAEGEERGEDDELEALAVVDVEAAGALGEDRTGREREGPVEVVVE
jgi:hypothetical protein